MIEVTDFLKNEKETISLSDTNGSNGHSGGDRGIMSYFAGLVRGGGESKSLTGADLSVQSHLMAFAAEKSRVEGKVIRLKEYWESLRA